MRAFVAEAATRLEAVSWTVYTYAVPRSPAARYLFIYSGVGISSADVISDVQRVRDVLLWVSVVSLNTNPDSAVKEVVWATEEAHALLMNWRPTTGELAFPATHDSTAPPRRDDDLPTTVAVTATNSYLFRIQPGS